MSKSRKDSKGRILRKGEGQRKDKRYIYQYTDPNGKRHVLYANDLPELRAKEDELERERLEGIKGYARGKMTLNQLVEKYLATKYDLKISTRLRYERTYEAYAMDNIGKRLINDIKYSDIRFFYYTLLRERNIKIGTVDSIHSVLHPAFQMAVRDDLIRNNPTDGVMAEVRKKHGNDAVVRHPLTIEQQRAFLSFTEKSYTWKRWMPLFTFLFGTGCRIGEALGLRWEDLDFENKTITIIHSLGYVQHNGSREVFLSSPKTEAGKRILPMVDAVEKMLKNERLKQQQNNITSCTIDGFSGFVFVDKNGKISCYQDINKAIKRISKAYNAYETVRAEQEERAAVLLPYFTCHYIRHTFCTRLCEHETNLKLIQSIMGHTSIKTTMDIYAETTEKKKQETFETLQNNNVFF